MGRKLKKSGASEPGKKARRAAAKAAAPAAEVPQRKVEATDDTQKVVDSESSSTVDSSLSSPEVANAASPATETFRKLENTKMDVTLVRGKISKSGKKVQFSNPALIRSLVFPVAVFGATIPESLSLSGEFATRSADEQAKAEARNAARAAKGLKPKATPAERQAQLEARSAKLQAKLARAQAAAAKLATKLGTAAPAVNAAQ
jgi:hypothetical protein